MEFSKISKRDVTFIREMRVVHGNSTTFQKIMARSKPRDIYRPPVAEASTCSSSPRRRAPLISAATRRRHRGASVVPYAPGYSCRHRARHNVAAEHGADAGVAPLAGVAGVARAPREPRFASYQKGRQHFSCSKEPQTSRLEKNIFNTFKYFFDTKYVFNKYYST